MRFLLAIKQCKNILLLSFKGDFRNDQPLKGGKQNPNRELLIYCPCNKKKLKTSHRIGDSKGIEVQEMHAIQAIGEATEGLEWAVFMGK